MREVRVAAGIVRGSIPVRSEGPEKEEWRVLVFA